MWCAVSVEAQSGLNILVSEKLGEPGTVHKTTAMKLPIEL